MTSELTKIKVHSRKRKLTAVEAEKAPVMVFVAATTTTSPTSTDGGKNAVFADTPTAQCGVGVVALTSCMTALYADMTNLDTSKIPSGAIVHTFLWMVVNAITTSLSIDGVGWT